VAFSREPVIALPPDPPWPIPKRRCRDYGTEVLIWINGPFGGGKTQTAFELHRRLPGSVVCDPEEPGFGLHRMTPPHLRGDFQDHAAWRQAVYDVLNHVLAHEELVIAPMTIIEPAYFDETVARLRQQHDVRHFALMATRETVLRRLRERGFGRLLSGIGGADAALRRESFAVSRIDLCLERLSAPAFAEHIWTDALSIADVVERIAVSADVTLEADTDSAARACARRLIVGAKHIRFL
jgi:hypothetical protein